MRGSTKGLFGLITVAGISIGTVAQAEVIIVSGYTYDLSEPDPNTGEYTTFHPDPAAQDPSNTKLTDGDPGSETLIVDPGGSSVFGNGTWVGFVNNGFGGAPQPRIHLDLGGQYNVQTVEVTYLVEDPTSIYAPQPVPIDPLQPELGNLFDAVAVSTSTNGSDYTEAAFSNDFTPIFGPGGDFGSGVRERRSVILDLANTPATHIEVEVHTPFSYIFLGEVSITGTSAALEGDLNSDGFVGIGDLNIVLGNWNQNVTVGSLPDGDPTADGYVGIGDLNIVLGNWNAGTPPVGVVPEPASLAMFGLGAFLVSRVGRRREGRM